MRKHDVEIAKKLKTEGYALSFDKRGYRVVLRFHEDLCHKHWGPPSKILKKCKQKLKDMVSDNTIETYETHFDTLKYIWKSVRRREYSPPDHIIRMSLAHCTKLANEITVSETEEHGAFAKISVQFLPKLLQMSFGLFRSIIYEKLKEERIDNFSSDSCLRYILLRIRHEQKDAEYFLFSGEPEVDRRTYILKNDYYNYYYLYVNEFDDNDHLYGVMLEQVENYLSRHFPEDAHHNFASDFHNIKHYLFNKPTAFGCYLPFDYLLAYQLEGTTPQEIVKSLKKQNDVLDKVDESDIPSSQSNDKETEQESGKEAQFILDIEDDEMSASFIDIRNPDLITNEEDFTACLQKEGVVFGYEPYLDTCYQKLKEGQELAGMTIAKGQVASPGTRLFMADLTNMNDTHNMILGVDEGVCVAELRYHDAVMGSTVTGKQSHCIAKVSESQVFVGDGIKVGDDQRFYTEYAGIPKISDDSIYVSKLAFHKGDYSPKFGTLEGSNSVVIEGDVEKGSRINVKNDLSIKGALFSDLLEVGGNLTVDGGILGDRTEQIEIFGDVKCNYLDQVKIRVHGNIHIEEYAMRSEIICSGYVLCKGAIANSSVYSCGSVEALNLGDENNNPTSLVVGVDFNDLRSIEHKEKRLKSMINAHKEETTVLEGLKEFNKKLKEKDEKKKINSGFYGSEKVEPKDTKPSKLKLSRLESLIGRCEYAYEERKKNLHFSPNTVVIVRETLFRNVSLHNEKKFESRDRLAAVFFSNADSEGHKPKDLQELGSFRNNYPEILIAGEKPKSPDAEAVKKAS